MLVTEEDARGKWCPHVRAIFHSDAGFVVAGNKFSRDYELEHLCIASECMMWRWHVKPQLKRVVRITANNLKSDFPHLLERITVPAKHNYDESEAGRVGHYASWQAAFCTRFAGLGLTANDFPNLSGWVKGEAPEYSEDNCEWFLRYSRCDDPAATGYCGLGGAPK